MADRPLADHLQPWSLANGNLHVTAAEAKPLETPDTFAQAAKLQRKALMREKHARELADLKVPAEDCTLQRCNCCDPH